jgi:hypothetical protein
MSNAAALSRYLRKHFHIISQPDHRKYSHEGYNVRGNKAFGDMEIHVNMFDPVEERKRVRELVAAIAELGDYSAEAAEGSSVIRVVKK